MKKKLILSSLLFFVLGVIITSLFWIFHNSEVIKRLAAQIMPLRQNNNSYNYINPLLGYNLPNDIKEFNNYKPLEQEIQKQIDPVVKDHSIDEYAVYFRDLSSGRWDGINENTLYSPGSMMKTAIMIAYFKEAEADPTILQQKYQYSSSTVDQINGVPFSSPSNLQVGKSYTVEDLIEAMIINSDNGAKDVLINHIDQRGFVEVHTDLGLPNPAEVSNYQITPKEYAILLRVLYNATYLSRADSEKALQILSQATYTQGLIAGVPSGTTVAHKFGEAVDSSNPANPEIALSDCGIVYHSSHPYILCVMIKGKYLSNLTMAIQLISQTVWSAVDAYSKTN